MTNSARTGLVSLGVLTVLCGLALPGTSWAWGAVGHHYIAQHYSQHLPPVIDGLRAYDSVVYNHVNDPDTRKPTTPGESYKHYIDIDSYPAFFTGTLSHDRAALESQYGANTVLQTGVLPWAIDGTMTALTRQFQAQAWDSVALSIADLCHYVGDANQPLHCTKNYDGQLTGNSGVHSRYESTMISTYLSQLSTSPMATEYYPNAVDTAFAVITSAWGDVNAILAADDAAVAASGGSYNSTYYATLWNQTKLLTQARLDTATVMTASFVYTAWQNAGEPVVPGSGATVPPLAVDAGLRLLAGPSPFRDVLTVRFAGASPLSVDVFDVRGARVARLAEGVSGQGSCTWRPASSGTGSGLYFIRLQGPQASVVKRVTLLQ